MWKVIYQIKGNVPVATALEQLTPYHTNLNVSDFSSLYSQFIFSVTDNLEHLFTFFYRKLKTFVRQLSGFNQQQERVNSDSTGTRERATMASFCFVTRMSCLTYIFCCSHLLMGYLKKGFLLSRCTPRLLRKYMFGGKSPFLFIVYVIPWLK